MKVHWIFWLLSLVMACSGQLGLQNQPSCSCTSGRKFVLLKPSKVEVIRTGPDSTIEITVLYDGTSFKKTLELELGEAANIPVPTNRNCLPLVITSDSDISLMSTDCQGNKALVPSVKEQRDEFVLVSPPGARNADSQVTIMPIQDTTVKISPTNPLTINGNAYGGGESITFRLQPLEVLKIDDNGDLSGVRVIADDAVAVILNRPCGPCDCSAVFEQIAPGRCFGSSFFTPGTVFIPPSATAVIVPQSLTTVQYTSGDQTLTRSVNPGKPLEIDASSPVSIKQVQDILVMVFKTGDTGTCPAVTLVPNSSEFCRKYKTFSKTDCTNELTITCKTDYCSQITIDGKQPTGITWVKFHGTQYSFGRLNLIPGSDSHILEHPNQGFGVQSACNSGNKDYSSVAVCISGSCSSASKGSGILP